MRKKKRTRAKKTSRRKAGRAKKTTRRKMVARGKKTAGRRKAARGKKTAARKKAARRKKPALSKRLAPNWAAPEEKGPGPDAGGQSGDIQGLSGVAKADSESVAELAEEGQSFEAEVVSGVENAPDADAGEIRTKEVPEDDVPPEYRERE
jgi:hypothetical protein